MPALCLGMCKLLDFLLGVPAEEELLESFRGFTISDYISLVASYENASSSSALGILTLRLRASSS